MRRRTPELDAVVTGAQDRATELVELGTATLGECGGRPLAPGLRPAWPGARLAGPAFTVRCAPGDNLAVHAGLRVAPAGSVLVVATTGDPDRGYWGEVLTTAAQTRGLVGLVIDGGVRDTAALERLGFPTFSATVALAGAGKSGPGSIGGVVRIGGVDIATADYVVADEDGVTSITADTLDAVLSAGRTRSAREREMFEQLRAGASTVGLLGLDTSSIDGA